MRGLSLFVGSFSRGCGPKFALKATHGGAESVGVFRPHIMTLAGKKPRERVGKKSSSNR